jgi:hypothetical protein
MARGTYDDFFAALRMKESSGNYGVMSVRGEAGAYQFQEGALKSIGWYNDDGTWGNDWRGSFTGQSGVSTIQQFLNSPTSQNNAMKAWAQSLWANAKSLHSTDHLGETINGTVVTATGILGGGHLWGPEAIDRYLDSGGAYDPRDPVGTSISDYVRLFSGYESPFDSPSTPSTPTTGGGTQGAMGSDKLVLKIAQDAYQGNAQYAVFVDDKQVGGTFTGKSLYGSGQVDTLEIRGDWGVGNHKVSVQLLNDLYGGSWDKDRNIWVESATYNDAAVANSKLSVASSTPQSFTVHDTTAYDWML